MPVRAPKRLCWEHNRCVYSWCFNVVVVWHGRSRVVRSPRTTFSFQDLRQRNAADCLVWLRFSELFRANLRHWWVIPGEMWCVAFAVHQLASLVCPPCSPSGELLAEKYDVAFPQREARFGAAWSTLCSMNSERPHCPHGRNTRAVVKSNWRFMTDSLPQSAWFHYVPWWLGLETAPEKNHCCLCGLAALTKTTTLLTSPFYAVFSYMVCRLFYAFGAFGLGKLLLHMVLISICHAWLQSCIDLRIPSKQPTNWGPNHLYKSITDILWPPRASAPSSFAVNGQSCCHWNRGICRFLAATSDFVAENNGPCAMATLVDSWEGPGTKELNGETWDRGAHHPQIQVDSLITKQTLSTMCSPNPPQVFLVGRQPNIPDILGQRNGYVGPMAIILLAKPRGISSPECVAHQFKGPWAPSHTKPQACWIAGFKIDSCTMSY